MNERDRDGIALVFASGLVVLLSLLAVFLVSMNGSIEAAARSGLLSVGTRLAAESGLHYAAGRLLQDPGYPVSILDAASALHDTRGDDWTFRDGVGEPLAGCAHVSYNHGEPWTDDGDGLREPAEPFADLDGDGRFTVRSGRLRGPGPDGAFSLKIVSAGALYPVNASANSMNDRWLIRLGDNLGSVLFGPGEIPGRFDQAHTAGGTAGEPIRVSHLGRHLLGEETYPQEDADADGVVDLGRPAKGYADLAEIRQVLLANGYEPRTADRILRYMDLGPYDPVASKTGSLPGYTTMPALELANASPEMLQALLLYYAHRVDGLSGAGLGFDLPYPRSSGSAVSRRYSNVGVMIYPDEAAAAAAWIAQFRRTPGRSSWRAFRERFWNEAARPDRGDLFAADTAPLPERGKWAWARAKADSVYDALSPETSLNPQSGRTWGMEPFPPEPDGIKRLTETIRWGNLCTPRYPAAEGASWPSSPYAPAEADVCFRAPATLAPATRYIVESLSGAGAAPLRGVLRAGERLEFTAQADFERDHVGGRPAASLGIEVIDADPANLNARRPKVRDEIANLTKPLPPDPQAELFVREIRGLVSAPAFNPNGLAADPSRTDGTMGLAPRSSAPQGARYYFPVAEDDVSSAVETEWLSDTSVSGTGLDDPFDLNHPSLQGGTAPPAVPLSPWAAQLRLDGGSAGANFPRFDFRPLAKNFLADADGDGRPDEEMRAFSIEFWDFDDGDSSQTLFLLEGDACAATTAGGNDNIRIQVGKEPGMDSVTGEAVVVYTVDFVAPGKSRITQRPPPPPPQMLPPLPNQGGYDMHFSVKVPRVRTEDANGNGQLDPGEDADGDGILDDWFVGNQNHIVLTVEIVNEPSPEDLNRNGILDPGEDSQDVNQNGALDPGENQNGFGILDAGEDVDGDCHLDLSEVDVNGNGVIDSGEDPDGDGKFDLNEDANGNNILDRNIDVILGFYVNGRLVEAESGPLGIDPLQWRGSYSDAFETYKTQTRHGWLRKNAQKNVTGGRGYPAYPYTASKMVPGKKMRILHCAGDDLRFYGDLKPLHQSLLSPSDPDYSRPVLTPGDVENRHALGRFFQPTPSQAPVYASPLYDLGSTARLKCAGWTGTPSGDPQVRDPGQERVGLSILLQTYNPDLSLREQHVLDPTEFATDLRSMEGSRHIGYKVLFFDNQPGDTRPLYHTPLFEGVWFTIQRRGPSWSRWE